MNTPEFNSTANILLVDDDQTLCELISAYLQRDNFTVESVHSGEAALQHLSQPNTIAAMVLDIMMPGLSGLEVLQMLRQKSNLPVIMLTGRGDDIDRILGLEMGADDYLAKPCNPRELVARLRAVLRRVKPQQVIDNLQPLQLHGITLDLGMLTAEVNNASLKLTSAELNTLRLLMESAGTTLTKQTLTEQVLHRKLEVYDRSIDVHISRLRQKLAAVGVTDIIKAIRGAGYQMISAGNHK
ncbi:response regulator transcription factor [Teredinibacter franksiae]|uniref:response regulator transcription factor n=1 Tax=Teredinibacter franksiae TaxID=2761453 RepID=UPI001623C040|nr:response regulator transcription factor [Teredinibacter franksiae]